jgi:hypothetical protein
VFSALPQVPVTVVVVVCVLGPLVDHRGLGGAVPADTPVIANGPLWCPACSSSSAGFSTTAVAVVLEYSHLRLIVVWLSRITDAARPHVVGHLR